MKQQLIVSTLTLADFLQRHPRQIAAAVAAVLMGSTGAAYAVASLGAGAASKSAVHLVTEAAALPSLQAQAQALEGYDLTLYRSARTRATDTAHSLLERLGMTDPDAAQFLRRNTLARKELLGHIGRQVRAEAGADGTLRALRVQWLEKAGDGLQLRRLLVQRAGESFVARMERGELQRGQRLAGGEVHSTLRAAADEAGVPEEVVRQLARVFEEGVDVQRLARGDRFSLVYETLEADGEVLRASRVLSAELVHKGEKHQALWFEAPGASGAAGNGAYYSFDGRTRRRAYLEAPLDVVRVTSSFGMRLHPVQGYSKAHKGVDYAAPRGTPVHAVREGKVEFAGVQSGYGNIVILGHKDGQETRYAHLSRIYVREGAEVAQGATLGAVGSTGMATGPHLHFEVRVDGEPINPTQFLAEHREAQPIAPQARKAFTALAEGMKVQLAAASVQRPADFE